MTSNLTPIHLRRLYAVTRARAHTHTHTHTRDVGCGYVIYRYWSFVMAKNRDSE